MITKNHGFSLIELLVTVAIVALLGVAGFQFYEEYSAKVWRSEAIIALSYQAGKMEECRARSGNSYTNCNILVVCRSLTDSTNAGCLQVNNQTLGGHYNLAVLIDGTGTTYTITASPVVNDPQINKDVSCMNAAKRKYDLVINQLGQYGISLGGAAPVFGTAQARRCWSK